MLQGLMAPLRIVLQRSFADWLIVTATWLVVLCAMTLVAIGVLYGDAVALTGLQRIIADQPPGATTVVVEMRASPDEIVEVSEAVDRQAGRILSWTDGELVTIAESESHALPEQELEDRTGLAVFGAYEALDRHAELDDGAWPRRAAEPMEVALSRAAAAALDLELGDELTLTSQRGSNRPVEVRLVGVWQPNDVTDPYWEPDGLALSGVRDAASFVTYGPFVVDMADLVERTASGDVALTFRVLPDFDNLAVDDVNGMRADTAALDRRLGDALGERVVFQVITELDTILSDVGRSLLVSRSGVVVLTIQFAVLAGYALLLVAGLLIDQRRVETALFRSRGAGTAQVALFSLVEALILVVPAVLIAPWLAVGVLRLLNVAGPLADAGVTIDPAVDDTAITATVLAGLAAVVALVAPTLSAGRGLASVRQTISRQGNRTLAQRLGIDLALVVLAGVGLWQLRQYGAPLTQTVRGTIGLDPLLVAAPAIALLAGSILALRIVPLAAEVGERLLVGRRGLVAPLGARQLARRPLRYTRSALLLMLAAALGTFAGAYASTWARSQADQAAYRAASDVRAQISDFPALPEWAIGQAIRSVEGVSGALPVALDRFDVAESDGTILALDAARAAPVITFRPDLADEPIERLLARLVPAGASTSGPVVDEEAAGVALVVTASLAATVPEDVPANEFSPGLRGILPSVIVRDADGAVHRISGPRLAVGLGEQHTEVSFGTYVDGRIVRPSFPLELLGVELAIQLPPETFAVGSLALDSVMLDEAGSLAPLATSPVDPVVGTEELPIAGMGATTAGSLVAPLGPASAADAPIPALASAEYLELVGAAVGDVVDLGSLAERRAFELVGVLRGFPTLDPQAPFLVVDLEALASADLSEGSIPSVGEWWLTTADGRAAEVARTLMSGSYAVTSAVAAEELRRDLLSDPVALGVIGALALGALAAVLFAGIGFIVSATVSTRERLGEFALLQAIGLSHRQLSAWLSMENLFLLLVGLIAGTALGLLMAWVVLPFVTLTQEATLAVPPVEVVIPWAIYGLLYSVALVALAVTVVVIGRLLARVRVSGVLRAGGE
jgi:FtsX-like permease family